MRPNPTRRVAPHRSHPGLTSLVDDCFRTVVGLLVYVGALALIGIVLATAAGPLSEAAINAATEIPAGRIDLAGNSDSPEALRRAAAAQGGSQAAATPSLGLRGAF